MASKLLQLEDHEIVEGMQSDSNRAIGVQTEQVPPFVMVT